MIILQMTGGFSSTAYYPRFIGRAAALSRTKTAYFIADVFTVTASSCADTQRPNLSSFQYSYLCIIPLGCPMSLCAGKCL